MGLYDRDYMRSPARPYIPEYRPNLSSSISRRKSTGGSKTRTFFGEMFLILIGIGVVVATAALQSRLADIWPLSQPGTVLRFCLVASLSAFGLVRLFLWRTSIFETPVEILAGIVHGLAMPTIVICGAVMLGVDFRVVFDHEISRGGNLPLFEGVVMQTPWWYLLGCIVVSGFLFFAARDSESKQWLMAFAPVFMISLIYLVGKVAVDTGITNWL